MNTTMSDDIPDLPEYASDLEADLALGGAPAKCTPEEGIRRMEARIKGLTAELEEALDTAQTSEAMNADVARLNHQLRDARKRLAEYEAQRDGKN